MSEQNKMTLFNTFGFRGLELRDYFAAKAMEALLHNWKEEVVPQMAYKIADEMLAEREKRDE